MTHSVAADRAFTAWAQHVAAGACGHDANYQAAMAASNVATTAKQRFCQLWNPVAATFGLPIRTESAV